MCGGDNRVFVFWLTRFWDRERRRRRRRKFRDNCRKKGKKKVLMISHRWEWVTSKLNPLSFSFSFCYLYSAGLSRHTPKKKGSSTPTNSPSILWILLHARQFSSSSFFFSFLFYYLIKGNYILLFHWTNNQLKHSFIFRVLIFVLPIYWVRCQ